MSSTGESSKHTIPLNPRSRKRTRQPVSCVSCQAKKIKCDRNKPCGNCTKRGKGSECVWKIVEREPSPKTKEILDLRRQLSEKEAIFEKLANSYKSSNPHLFPAQLTSQLPTRNEDRHSTFNSQQEHPINVQQHQHAPLPHQGRDHSSSYSSGSPSTNASVLTAVHDSSTEIAAIALEDMALGRSAYSKFGTNTDIPLVGQIGPNQESDEQQQEDENPIVNSSSPSLNEQSYTSIINRDTKLNQDIQVAGLKLLSINVHDSIIPALPPPHIAKLLVNSFFQDMHFIYHIIHRPTFLDEARQFWDLQEQSKLSQVDPTWIAVYFMVLSWAAATYDPYALKINSDEISKEDMRKLPEFWANTSYRLIQSTNWLEQPRIRTLQALLLLTCHQAPVAHPQKRQNRSFFILLNFSIQIARVLRLHDLGDDPRIMPPWDPSWPPGPSSLRREMGLRLWSFCLSCDWAFCTHIQLSQIKPGSFTSCPPTHCNDDDIGLHLEAKERPLEVICDTSFEESRRRLGVFQKKASSIVNQTKVDYQQIKELDDILQDAIRKMPTRCENPTSLRPYHIGIIESLVHNRVVRLHRPFMLNGFHDEELSYSTANCLKSSLAVIHSQSQMFEARLDRFWYLFSHVIGAVITLFMYLSEKPPTRHPGEAYQVEQAIYVARAVFERGKATESESIAHIASQGLHIIANLNNTLRTILQENKLEQSSHHQHDTASSETFRSSLGETFRRLLETSASQTAENNGQNAATHEQPVNDLLSSLKADPLRSTDAEIHNGYENNNDHHHFDGNLIMFGNTNDFAQSSYFAEKNNTTNAMQDHFERDSQQNIVDQQNGNGQVIFNDPKADWTYLLQLGLEPVGLTFL